MALEADFLSMCSTSVSVTAHTGFNSYGAPQFSTSVAVYSACVEFGERKVVSHDGTEQIASATVFVMSSSASISPSDRVTLPLTSNARLLRVDVLNDDEGQHHLELLVA